jgi:hypothetical protein
MEELRLAEDLTFWVPSRLTEERFRAFLAGRQAPAGIRLSVTGNPGLAVWDQAPEGPGPLRMRAELSLPEDGKVILFPGGCDPDHERYFRIFVQGVRNRPGLQVLVVAHPRTDGRAERAAIRAERAGNVRLVEPSDAAPMPALGALADLVACHQSSVGLQARHLGKPVLCVADPAEGGNLLVEQGLARIAGTPPAVAAAVDALLAPGPALPGLAALGIPEDATGRIVADLEAALGSPAKERASAGTGGHEASTVGLRLYGASALGTSSCRVACDPTAASSPAPSGCAPAIP